MQHNSPMLSALRMLTVTLLLGFSGTAALADEESSQVSEHLEAAEIALQGMDYLVAAREYRLAAELSDDVEVAIRATSVTSTLGLNEDALAAARRWLKLDEDSDEALFYVARFELRNGNMRAAKRRYRQLLEAGDEEPDRRLLSLIGVLGEEDAEAGNEIMQTLARPYRDSPYAKYAAAVMSLQADDLDTAREQAMEAIEMEPDPWLLDKAKLLYGRILLVAGETDEAIDYVARIIGDDPQPAPDARMELALIMMSAGRNDDALSQVNQVLLENSNNFDALRLMAIINFREGNLDAAWEDFEDLLSTRQHTMDALYYLARISDFREESERAIRLYSQVRSGSHTVTSQRRAAALIAFTREDEEAALAHLDNFASTNPALGVDMVQAKAQLLAALDRYDESLEYYDLLIQYRPDSEGVMLGRGELLLRMDRLDDAIEQYRAAVRRYPDSAISLNALGYTLADRTDRYREAERLIRKALELNPDSSAIIDSMGWVLFKLGRHEEALVELRRAYEGLEDAEVAAHIVEVLAVLDRREEALEFLVEAEEKFPESPLLEDVRERMFPEAD
ncbi:MAG: tetratricopeptide repeat protein [Woeseiaceae bacterium]|nr:tetratricopeptide repeat protein [Woeseiaceae bacterium]